MIYVIKRRAEAHLGLLFYCGPEDWDIEVNGAVRFDSLAECQEQVARLDGYGYGYDNEPPSAIALCCDGPHRPRMDLSGYGARVWREGDRHFANVQCERCLAAGQIEVDLAAVAWGAE